MTTPTKLEVVRKRCIEANPEINALFFGCRVNPTCDSYWFVLHELVGGYVEAIEIIDDEGVPVFGKKQRIWPKEILGRDIRLADVLLVIEKVKGFYSIDLNYDGTIQICKDESNGGGEWETVKSTSWDLHHDSLSWHAQNRPEVITFLAELLQ